jgi:hypothetical protein
MVPKFTVQEIERTITWPDDDSEEYVDEYDEGTIEPTDLRGALDALNSQCWDNLDAHGDGTIIGYPADSHMNMRTGADESTQLIIKARRPEWADRLMACYRPEA